MTTSEELAIEFVRALANREFVTAYDLTTADFRSACSCEEMQNEFESIVPEDWGVIDPIEIGTSMDDWPGKSKDDIKWVYVVIGGDAYSEAVILVTAQQSGILRVRQVEWGRP